MKRAVEFLRSPAGSAVPMLAAAVLVLIIANTPYYGLLDELLDTRLVVTFADRGVAKPLLLWINDGLMAVFFLLVGLEIKREVLEGELSRPSEVALPIAGAVGGIVLPAAIYVAFTWGHTAALRGWAIPSATDIAFAVAVLAALGNRVPAGIRLFLLTLAIVDDLAAIVIIAAFYTANLSTLSLALAGLCIAVLVALNLTGVRRSGPYLVVGAVLWVCVLKSGVHATLAGVVLAFCMPLAYAAEEPEERPFVRLEHALSPWVSFLVLPAFAFANAGLHLAGLTFSMMLDPVAIGIVAGLFVGKQVGIFAFAAMPIVLGRSRLPPGATWLQLYGAGICGGIGFTMSLFIGTLAFPDDLHEQMVRLGVIVGSLLSAAFGFLVLHMATKPESD
jgi:NhaA family Na+:H+ antiporter